MWKHSRLWRQPGTIYFFTPGRISTAAEFCCVIIGNIIFSLSVSNLRSRLGFFGFLLLFPQPLDHSFFTGTTAREINCQSAADGLITRSCADVINFFFAFIVVVCGKKKVSENRERV